MHTIPTIGEFMKLFSNEKECIDYLLHRNVFYSLLDCTFCHQPMKRYPDKGEFRCNRTNCEKRGARYSIRIGTFFYGSKMDCRDILLLALLWLSKASVETAQFLSGNAHQTVSTFYGHFRQLISSALNEEDQIIGGNGIIVEVDETKLGKRKYNCGHRVDGIWVVVGIERLNNGKIFLVPVQDRSSETLSQIISDHIIPGSEIHTDLWKGYNGIGDMGYTHFTVNHSQNFVDPYSGACTNTVEGLNSGLKRRILPRNRTSNHIGEHLGEYVWRRQNKDRLWDAFINAIKDVHYEFEQI
jgi:transposase-like protein